MVGNGSVVTFGQEGRGSLHGQTHTQGLSLEEKKPLNSQTLSKSKTAERAHSTGHILLLVNSVNEECRTSSCEDELDLSEKHRDSKMNEPAGTERQA